MWGLSLMRILWWEVCQVDHTIVNNCSCCTHINVVNYKCICLVIWATMHENMTVPVNLVVEKSFIDKETYLRLGRQFVALEVFSILNC